jgi:RNA ligase
VTFRLDTLDAYVEKRLLSRQDQGPLSIYNYTDLCTYSRAWDEITLNARGLILNRERGEVVARPFPKFFNLGERGIEQTIPEAEPDVVTVKHDGSLGISYPDPATGLIRWSTRGSFTSPQAAAAQRIWAREEPANGLTLLVEIIAPESFNIVRYDREELILLGVRDVQTGSDYGYSDVCHVARCFGLHVAERVDGTVAELAARAAKMDHTEEGFVVRWGDYRVKVKSAEYLRVARILTGLNERRMADLWYARDLALVAAIPEEFRGLIEEHFAAMDRVHTETIIEFHALMVRVAEITDRKAFVQSVGSDHPLFGCAMKQYDGKDPDLRMAAYRRVYNDRPRDPRRDEGVG